NAGHGGAFRRGATRSKYRPRRNPITTMTAAKKKKSEGKFPAQHQDRQPGVEARMQPRPEYIREGYVGSRRLAGKNCLITGGDSGIGRAVAVHFAAEGAASIGIVYLREQEDAEETRALVEERGA